MISFQSKIAMKLAKNKLLFDNAIMPIRKKYQHLFKRNQGNLDLNSYVVIKCRNVNIDTPQDFFGKKVINKRTNTEKLSAFIKNYPPLRIGLVVTEDVDYSIRIANTLFLLEALPPQLEIVAALSIDAINQDSQLQVLVDKNRKSIAYSNQDGFPSTMFNIKGEFFKDKESLTGLVYNGISLNSNISDYSSVLSLAVSVVNCCFGGKGVPAGVDWKNSVEYILSNSQNLNSMVEAASLGHVLLPSQLPKIALNPIKQELLYEYLVRSSFQRSPDNDKKIVDVFSTYLVDGGNKELLQAAINMKTIERLWKEVPATFDESIIVDNINPNAETMIQQINSLGSMLGMESYIEACVAGIPLEDLFA